MTQNFNQYDPKVEALIEMTQGAIREAKSTCETAGHHAANSGLRLVGHSAKEAYMQAVSELVGAESEVYGLTDGINRGLNQPSDS